MFLIFPVVSLVFFGSSGLFWCRGAACLLTQVASHSHDVGNSGVGLSSGLGGRGLCPGLHCSGSIRVTSVRQT